MAKKKRVKTTRENRTKVDIETLQEFEKEAQKQELPEQKKFFTVSERIKGKVHNLPDPKNPPLGWDPHTQGFRKIYPYVHLPIFHPTNFGDTVIFNAPGLPVNRLILGDNLHVLRALPSESIDLIYIDPPFFSGRQYNVIWGDTNEVRTFYDIWEGGIGSYLIWLNARLWEMRRVLKKTGSIYVHCDWHASHYIKIEMDKIFGYENFRNEIIWNYGHLATLPKKEFPKKHDILLLYSKTNKYKYFPDIIPSKKDIRKNYPLVDEKGRRYRWVTLQDKHGKLYKKKRIASRVGIGGVPVSNVWNVPVINPMATERIGYPTQKPEALLKRVIKTTSEEGDLVADFFCGGGTTPAVAMKLKRRFIACDSSRVAITVSLDRLVKVGEDLSGVKSNISTTNREISLKKDLFSDEVFQQKLQTEGVVEKVPNIEVSYLGVYPIEKFINVPKEEFVDFVLTCYSAKRNTAKGITSGYRPPGQQEPILVGESDSNKSISAEDVKAFFEEIKEKLEPNKLVRAKIIGWKFSRQVIEYQKVLKRYAEKHNLPIEIELIPLDSQIFRTKVLQKYPDASENEFYLRFSKAPVIGDIRVKKIKSLEYQFEAMDALSVNEGGWLVNCQWDFDYQEGHFAAHSDYVLSRKKVKRKRYGEIFEAMLNAKHKFGKEGKYTIACKVQDNLAGETILTKKIDVKK